ncbi:hypothetical protein BESB_012050 [Besnoitia besnoiti]|uniref:TerD domain-containing protein n=1 Tax=Besnoitia besnoiti TaxID=94643 RepID=A0A2A9MA79_BESBE|nr:hypothetical protein BESB_012050 [Besnoitia besnoiti]PFH32593.1 hypothetical protein BESB_012050 [Besnoitia besnoiti]
MNTAENGISRMGTTGYGAYLGTGEDDEAVTTSSAAQPRRKGSSLHRGSFYGRLGTRTSEAEPRASLLKTDTGKAPHVMKQMRVQLFYDEDAYPAGVELDLFALLYDKDCKFLDCVFYRNTEGVNGAFSLNVATNSLAMDLTRVPEECSVIVLAAAVYTLGLTLPELERGRIQICGGFMGPTVKDIVLSGLEAPPGTPSTAGLVYFAIGERGGQWYYKDAMTFTKPSLDAIMRPAKELADQLDLEMRQPHSYGLPKLDALLEAANARRRGLSFSSDGSSGHKSTHNFTRHAADPLEQSLSRANSLRQRIAAIKHTISSHDSLSDYVKADVDEGFRRKVNARLSDIDERQSVLEDTLNKVIARLDYLYAYVGVEEDDS